MSYNFISSGERIVLDVIANADDTIANIQINGLKMKRIPFEEYYNICHQIGFGSSYHDLFTHFLKNNALLGLGDNSKEPDVLVVEVIDNPLATTYLCNVLKLYKSIDIFSCHSTNYKCIDSVIRFGGYGKTNAISEHVIIFSEKYSLNAEEIAVFPEWYNKHYEMLSTQKVNPIFKNAVDYYIRSFLIPDPSQAFVMLMIILEMIFCNESSELSYRIKRGCSYFLSHSREEMETYIKSVSALYTTRSKYVHKGERVKLEQLYELRELTRQVLIMMYEQHMHTEKYNFKTFRDDLTYCGYYG